MDTNIDFHRFDDMLHHNRKGYEELAALLKPTLEEWLYGAA